MKLVKANSLKEEGTSHNPEVKKASHFKKRRSPHQMMLGTAVLQPGQEVSPHSHDSMHEVFVMQEGQLEFIVNQNSYVLDQGDCITIAPKETTVLKTPPTNQLKCCTTALQKTSNKT